MLRAELSPFAAAACLPVTGKAAPGLHGSNTTTINVTPGKAARGACHAADFSRHYHHAHQTIFGGVI